MLYVYRFLAHLSQRLKWAIVISQRPLSVRPSSVLRPSLNFHSFDFFSRTAWWILMKLGRHEVLMVPNKCCCFSARSAKERIQGGAKIGHGGPLLQESSSSDWKATATNRMLINDLEALERSVVIFGSIPKSNFWRVFDVFLDLVILPYFNAISIHFYAVKWKAKTGVLRDVRNSKVQKQDKIRRYRSQH